jgi:hypothetical protein
LLFLSPAAVHIVKNHNPLPYYQYAASNYVTGDVQVPLLRELQRVVQRMQLSPLQMLHMRISIKEYNRLCQQASSEADRLAAQIEQMNLAAVEGNNSAVPRSVAGPTTGGAAAAAATNAAAAAAAAQDDDPGATKADVLQRQLDRYLHHIRINISLAVTCIGKGCDKLGVLMLGMMYHVSSVMDVLQGVCCIRYAYIC